ncbi:MAG: hypothetical protein V4494_01495 [Chlamydiota bacterium]
MKQLMALSLLTMSSICLGTETHSSSKMSLGNPKPSSPWFTGPLLTPSPNVVTIGHYNIEPYVYYGSTTSQYDGNWHTVDTPTLTQLRFQVPIQFGLTQWMDIAVTPQVIHTWSQGAQSTRFTDLPVQFDFQILKDRHGWNWHPSLRFTVKESFPVGEYQRLSPNKHKTDIGGSGSFATSMGFVIGKLFNFFSGVHYLNTRFSISYTYPAPVHVRGFNTYGGGYGTAGKVYPGNVLGFLLGLEYSMTQRWVLALDAACTTATKTRFKGSPGSTTRGGSTPAQVGGQPIDPLGLGNNVDAVVGGPSSARFSLAPALEYNWNANLGLIIGGIVSVGGRNSVRFASGSAAFNYYY